MSLKVQVSQDDIKDNRKLETILQERRRNCRRYESTLFSKFVLDILDSARGQLGYMHKQNRRLWQNPRTKLLKALAAVGLSSSPVLGECSTHGKDRESIRKAKTPQRSRPAPMRRRASLDSVCESETENSELNLFRNETNCCPKQGANPQRQRNCSPIIRDNNTRHKPRSPPSTPLPRVPAPTATTAVTPEAMTKPKSMYSENGWSRPRKQLAPTTPLNQNISDLVPKSEIKATGNNNKNQITLNNINEWSQSNSTDASKALKKNEEKNFDSSEKITCSILVDGKIYNDVNISRASIEDAIQREIQVGRERDDREETVGPPSAPISTLNIATRSKKSKAFEVKNGAKSPRSVRPVSAHATRPSRQSFSSLPSAIESSDDHDNIKYGLGTEETIIVAGMPQSSKSFASPRVKIKKSKYAEHPQQPQRTVGFNPSFEPSNDNTMAAAYRVQRGVWNGGAGGPGWIGLDQPHDDLPAQSKRASTSIASNRASNEHSSKWDDVDNPFVSRRGKIRNTNECSVVPSNKWSPEMAYERYGDGGGFFFA